MAKKDDEKEKKKREKDEKESKGMDFSAWFNNQLDEQIKARAKTHKPFKHEIHNYTTGMVIPDYFINPKNPGILAGNIVQFAGKGGSGKTTTALNMASFHMMQGHKVIYCDPEDGLEESLCEGFGFSKWNNPQFTYVPARLKAEQYFQLIKNTLLHMQGEVEPILIIVDSISYLRPEVETFETVRVGDNIPFFNNFLRAVRPLVGNTNCLLVLLNGCYQDNKSQHGGVIVNGGETLWRACDLITLHEKRVNATGKQVTADEITSVEVNKNYSISYRQKLAMKILKNKWQQSDTKLSSMEHYFTTDPRFGKFGLDNIHSMMSFLKDMGEFDGGSLGWYAINEQQKMRWADWEQTASVNPEVHQLLLNKTLEVLNNLFFGDIGK